VGAGTLLEHSIHDVDILRWFGGEVGSVRGEVSNFAGYDGVEDLVVATLRFESGATASLTSVWHSVVGRPSTRRLEFFFEKGIFWVDHDYSGPINMQVHALNPQVVSEEEVKERYLAQTGLDARVFEGLLRYSLEDYFFLKAVAEDAVPFPNFQTALGAHRVVDAIYRSGAGGGDRVDISG
jgi:predicted dehydrogenase